MRVPVPATCSAAIVMSTAGVDALSPECAMPFSAYAATLYGSAVMGFASDRVSAKCGDNNGPQARTTLKIAATRLLHALEQERAATSTTTGVELAGAVEASKLLEKANLIEAKLKAQHTGRSHSSNALAQAKAAMKKVIQASNEISISKVQPSHILTS